MSVTDYRWWFSDLSLFYFGFQYQILNFLLTPEGTIFPDQVDSNKSFTPSFLTKFFLIEIVNCQTCHRYKILYPDRWHYIISGKTWPLTLKNKKTAKNQIARNLAVGEKLFFSF